MLILGESGTGKVVAAGAGGAAGPVVLESDVTDVYGKRIIIAAGEGAKAAIAAREYLLSLEKKSDG